MTRSPRNRYVQHQKVRGANAANNVATARSLASAIYRRPDDDYSLLIEDARGFFGNGVVTALEAMGIA